MTFVALRPPVRELFFAPLLVSMEPGEIEKIQFAYQCSKYGHAKQVRSHGGRYFDHPKSAAWIYISELAGRDPRIIIDLLLHDLQEDQYLLSPHRASLNFGPAIALDMHVLTKLPKGKETTEQYLGRIIAQGPWAMVSKLIDRLHNLRELAACPAEKIRAQIEETRMYHLRLLPEALRKHKKHWVILTNKIVVLIEEALAQHAA